MKEFTRNVGDLRGSTSDLTTFSEKLDASTSQLRSNMEAKVRHLEHGLEHLEEHLCESRAEHGNVLLSKSAFE